MPVYEYKGFDRAGKNKKGIIDADSAITARQRLRGSGVFTIDIKEALSRQKGLPHSSALSNFFKRVKSGELSAAT
ncbi:MAG TPA: type II secretion system protein GspF, partial [Desulfobacteraceae bacterium]|nr:type II secretion system protein GspF [Desulfobacteraceae bacterium]